MVTVSLRVQKFMLRVLKGRRTFLKPLEPDRSNVREGKRTVTKLCYIRRGMDIVVERC